MAAKQFFKETASGIPVTLSGETAGWEIRFESCCRDGVEFLECELSATEPLPPPRLMISLSVPQREMQVKWHPLNELWEVHHNLPWWRDIFRTGLTQDAPVCCYLNLRGENQFCFALSDARRECRIATGLHENGRAIAELTLFSTPEPPLRRVSFSLRIDRRPLPLARLLAAVSNWYAAMPEYTPAPVPEAAEEPFYSTWYQYQKDVSQEELERELPLIAGAGMRSIILDDGWQCELAQQPGGEAAYANCGTWIPYPGKFPDLAAHVERFHRSGLRYLMWIALPFVGRNEKVIQERFRGKFLEVGSESGVLDPRYPEVREYLTDVCLRMVREWNLDGLKLDFIDQFRIDDGDPAAARGYAGCDPAGLPDAVDRLLSGIIAGVRALKPDILIEFRQHYNGPGMRKYGNIFRASDCAFDCIQNRVRIADIRLLAGETAVHSDMIAWSVDDSVESAALQVLNVLFAVPQISMRLQTLPADHMRMLKFWLGFWMEHRETLLHGVFLPEHPELGYPVLQASGKEECVIVVYEADRLIRIPAEGTTWLVNAGGAPGVAAELDAPAELRYFNVFGEPAGGVKAAAGPGRFAVPESGFAMIVPE